MAQANVAYLMAVRGAYIGTCFSNPITAVLGLASAGVAIANALDIDRCIKFAISNNTSRELKFICSHMDCGEIDARPETIEPGQAEGGYVHAKFGAYGVKGALIYQWGDAENNERICFFFENPVRGRNKSGVRYYGRTAIQDPHWYYCNVPAKEYGKDTREANGSLVTESSISGGDSAGAAFVVATPS